MATALNKLKGFVQTFIDLGFGNISDRESDELKTFFSETLSSLQSEAAEELTSSNEDREKRRYMANLQAQISYLAEAITGFEHEHAAIGPLSVMVRHILEGLFEFVEHLRMFFYAYFDFETKPPVRFIEFSRASYRFFGADLAEKMKRFEHRIDPELSLLIQNFCAATDKSERFKVRTWRQWDYLLQTVAAIADFFEGPAYEDINLELLKLFICRELNSIQVYAYFLKYIERSTAGDASLQDQRQDLLYLLKVFRQVRSEAGQAYDPKIQSLKTSVIDSLTAELNYLEQKEKLILEDVKTTNPEEPSKFYFKVVVTLSELMFLFRVMLEVGFIQTKFNSYLYEFISNHIRTQRAENISKKSMRNHFHNKPFPERLVKSIRAWLEKMIIHIDLYYKV